MFGGILNNFTDVNLPNFGTEEYSSRTSKMAQLLGHI